MDDITGPTLDPMMPNVKSPKRRIGRVVILVIVMLLLTGIAGAGGYLWRDMSAKTSDKERSDQILALQQSKADLEKQLTTEKSKNAATMAPVTTPCTVKAPGAATIENIESSITSGNTAALAGYMASSVTAVIAGSAPVAGTPDQAIASITNFITPATASWDYNFSLPPATLNIYKNGAYKQYFSATAVVGKATNHHVIAFLFDCSAKIDTVFMAASDSVL